MKAPQSMGTSNLGSSLLETPDLQVRDVSPISDIVCAIPSAGKVRERAHSFWKTGSGSFVTAVDFRGIK